jgi:hypothetical protein
MTGNAQHVGAPSQQCLGDAGTEATAVSGNDGFHGPSPLTMEAAL